MIKFLILHLRHIVHEEELESRVLWRTYGVIAWVSFLFAGVATMLFFATFDPIELANLATYPADISPLAGYSIGFLLFWILGFCCTTVSCLLLALPLRKRRKLLPDDML